MTDDKFYTSLSANNIMAKLTNHVQRTRLITPSTDKHYSLDSEDDFRSGCRNVSHQQQFFSELLSPGRSHNTNYWYSWVQTIYNVFFCFPNPRWPPQILANQKPTSRSTALTWLFWLFRHFCDGIILIQCNVGLFSVLRNSRTKLTTRLMVKK